MAQLDRVFTAFQAMTAAKLAKAKHDPNAIDPQSALQQAGGVDAWNVMLALIVHASPPAGQTAHQCPNVPVTMP
jgi:hypothetical protein